MKKLIILSAIASFLALNPLSVQPASTALPEDVWLFDAYGYARAVELQRQFKVPLVVYFYADWCPYCRTLDSQYLPSAPVQQYLSRVVKVRINPEHGPAERDIAARFGVTGYPAFFVLTSLGRRKVSPFRKNLANLTPAEFAKACQQGGRRTTQVAVSNPITKPPMVRNSGAAIGNNTSRKRGGVRITEVAPPRQRF